jgi:tRNA dimethylallyltransferase
VAKTCIVIVGPTAVGKTLLAVQTALHFKTEIISADSRQCFKELNIGVAKPSADELALVKHHFISSNSILDEMNTGIYEQYALDKARDIFKDHDVAVVVGGTGLYVKTFCQGIDEVPVIDEKIRKKINAEFEWEGLESSG